VNLSHVTLKVIIFCSYFNIHIEKPASGFFFFQGRRVIVEMQHGAQLGKKSSNPIQKVVNPVGTVITVSLPSEEWGPSQTSNFGAAVPSECESSAEKERGMQPLHRCSRKDSSSSDDTFKWPAVSKPPCCAVSEGYEPSECVKSKMEAKTQRKSKGSAQNVSGKRCGKKHQDEKRDDHTCSIEERKKDNDVTIGKTQQREIMVPSSTNTLENGPLALSTAIWERDPIKRKADVIESKAGSQKNLVSKTTRTELQDMSVKENMDDKNSKDFEVQTGKSKIKNGNNSSCKSKSFLTKSIIIDESSVQGNLKKGKNFSPDEATFCEAPLSMDAMKLSEVKSSKRSPKNKATSIACAHDKSIKVHAGSFEGEKKDDRMSASHLVLMHSAPSSDSQVTQDNEGTKPRLEDVDSLRPAGAHGIIKKANMKNKVSKYLLPEDKALVTVTDSGDNGNSVDKLSGLLVSVPEIEPVTLYSSSLNERFNEHHFGMGGNVSLEALGDSDLHLLTQRSEVGPQSLHTVQSVAEEKSTNQTTAGSENKSHEGNTELEASSDQGSQENLIFRSTFDDVFVSPVRSWSSIVSSSNINRSPVRETVAADSAETVLLKLEDLRISPQPSWSDTAKGSPNQTQIATTSNTGSCRGFEGSKGPEDTDHYSGEHKDKFSVDSCKSLSSDQSFCSKLVTADKSLGVVATSESSVFVGNEENCSQLNEESNGNDEELADNGESASISASQGANKKSRRMKKKKIKSVQVS